MADLKNILEFAMREEEKAFQLYSDTAARIDSDAIKSVLLKLAQQEKVHKERIKALFDDELHPDMAVLSQIDISKDVVMAPLTDMGRLGTLLKGAIEAEVDAKELYAHLSKALKDPDASALLQMLSDEEATHERILKDLLENLP